MIDDERRELKRAAARVAARFASHERRGEALRVERLALMARMFAAGFTTAEIARAFDVSRSYVGRMLGYPHEHPGRPAKGDADGRA